MVLLRLLLAHHDLKGAMADNSLEHQLLAMANTD